MRSKITFFALAAALIIGVLAFYLPAKVDGESRSSSPSPTPTISATSTPTPTQSPKPLLLLCMNRSTKALRTSDVKSGCRSGESSLGATAIKQPSKRPTGFNPFLKTHFLAAQAALFAAAVEKYGSEAEAAKSVLPPNCSRHPWGLALDINYPNGALSAKWLEINGYKYGLCRVYKNEWWHFEGSTVPGHRCPAMHPDATWDLE